jgi:hypothetical protein
VRKVTLIEILLLIFLGVVIAFVVDKLYLEDRFHRVALPSEDEVMMLDRERLTKMLNKSQLYENLRRTHEIHRGRSMSRHTHRRAHLAQAGDAGNGKSVLPPGERSKL